jgi:hypothetical protein
VVGEGAGDRRGFEGVKPWWDNGWLGGGIRGIFSGRNVPNKACYPG